MKAILEFDLPEEEPEFETAVNGWKWKMVLTRLDNELRKKLKSDLSDEQFYVYTEIRDKIHELKADENLSFD